MTTIAYCLKARRIATDGRVVEGDEISTDEAEKRIVRHGLEVFYAGAIGDVVEIVDAFRGKQHRVGKAIYAQALVWDGATLWELYADEGRLTWHPVVAARGAIGSGCGYALTALEFGSTPRQAVQAAAKRDTGTGGKIRTYTMRQKQPTTRPKGR